MLSDLKATDILEIIQFFHFDNPIIRSKAFICKDYKQVIIGVNMVKLKCHNCGREIEVETPPKEFVCTCGAVNVVPTFDGTGDAACTCLVPTGFEWQEPAGVKAGPGGKIYITAQGTEMTKDEYIKAFKLDPDLALAYMRELGREGKEGYTNVSTLGKKKVR